MHDHIEQLETRRLFSTAPVVTGFKITPRSPDATTQSVVFQVTYESTIGMNPTSFDNRDVRIAGPNGYARYARAFTSSSNGDGTQRVVRYKIPPPHTVWTSNDNGTYTVRLHGDQVLDILNNAAAPQALGKFSVNISRTRAATHSFSIGAPQKPAPKVIDLLE